MLVGLRKPFAYLRGDLWEEMGIRKKQLHWQQRSLTQRASRAGCRIKPLGTASPATNASVSRPSFVCLLLATKLIEMSGRGRARSGGRDMYAPFARASCGASPTPPGAKFATRPLYARPPPEWLQPKFHRSGVSPSHKCGRYTPRSWRRTWRYWGFR